jgi:uncharacterized protein
MKILVLADIDEFHWKHGSGKADILISCGDVSDQLIIEAAKAYNCERILAVKGNHDTNSAFPELIKDLHLQVEEFIGLKFGGLNGCVQYKPVGYFLHDQWEVEQWLESFPSVDIFVSHNSPRHIHDQDEETHNGFEALNAYIQRVKPKILLHGHQHKNKETYLGQTLVAGIFGYKLIEI